MKTNAKNIELLKDIIRHPYAWPGGYERAAIMSDGGRVCWRCLREEYYNVLHSTKYQYADDWDVVGEIVIYEPESYCAHCGRELNM